MPFRMRIGHKLLVVLASAAVLSTPAVAGDEFEDLLLALKKRSLAFREGSLHAVERRFQITSGKADQIRKLLALLSETPLTARQAVNAADGFEKSAVEALGPGERRSWQCLFNEVGTKLTEVVPVKDDSEETFRRIHGFQNGMIARYDEHRKQLLLAPGTSDAAFAFRPAMIDPTTAGSPLLHALKMDGRKVSFVPMDEIHLVVTSYYGGINKFFFTSVEGQPLLTKQEGYTEERALRSRLVFGNFGPVGGKGPALRVPHTSILIDPSDDGTIDLTVYTVSKWKREKVKPERLEIKVAKGTNVIRRGSVEE